jgi:hypothetical protein
MDHFWIGCLIGVAILPVLLALGIMLGWWLRETPLEAANRRRG